MEYKKYNLKKYNIHLIKTNKFKTITLTINFKRKVKKEDITIRRLLADVLLESSMKYPSVKLLEMETEELYGLSLKSDSFISGNYDIMSFSQTFLSEKYTELGMNKRSILFMLQLLLNPDIKNNEFSEYGFDLGYRIVKSNIKGFSDYPSTYSSKRMLEVMDKNSSISYRNCGYLKDLNKISRKDLYNYYKSVIEDDIIDIAIIGDIEDDIIDLFKNNFTRIKDNQKSESHYIKVDVKKLKEKQEKAKINQSQLVIGCNVDYDDEKFLPYVLNIYSFILGGSGDSLLFKTVREENSLCYHISSSYNIICSLISIKAGIDGKNYSKTVELIKQCMNKLETGDFNDDEIEKAKIIYKNSCIEMMDAPGSIINNFLSHEYLKTDLIKDRVKKIDMVTKEMVMDLAKKIKINTIYMLEGENNEKKV